MGQPTHALTAHVGKTQLWENGFFTHGTSFYWGPRVFRINVLMRVVSLFCITPLFINQTNLWHSKIFCLRIAASRFKKRNVWQAKPDFENQPHLWNRYFRQIPTHGLFMDGDQLVTQQGYIEGKWNEDIVVGKTRAFMVKGTTVLTTRALSLRQVNMLRFPKIDISGKKKGILPNMYFWSRFYFFKATAQPYSHLEIPAIPLVWA